MIWNCSGVMPQKLHGKRLIPDHFNSPRLLIITLPLWVIWFVITEKALYEIEITDKPTRFDPGHTKGIA